MVTFSLLMPVIHILDTLSHIEGTDYGIKMSHKMQYLTMNYGCESLFLKNKKKKCFGSKRI